MRKIISALLLTVAVALPVVAQAADPRDRGEGRMAERERNERSPNAGQSQRAAAPAVVSERSQEVRESRREVQDSRRELQDSRRELRQDRADPATTQAELRGDRREVRRDERELVRDRVDLRGDQRDLRNTRDDRRDFRRDDRRDNARWDAGRWGRYDDRGWRFSYSTPGWNSYWTPYGFGQGDRLTLTWGIRWYDDDRNGRMSDREWRRAQQAFYRFADRNRDGYVSRREYDWAVDAIRYNRYGGW